LSEEEPGALLADAYRDRHLGNAALGVRLIASVPISWLANAYVYRRLQLQAENEGAIPLSGLD